MKDNRQYFIRWALGILLVIGLGYGVFSLLSPLFNGAFKEWFYDQFMVEVYIPEYESFEYTFRGWSRFKDLMLMLGVVLGGILIFASVISSYLYAKYISQKELALITETLQTFSKSDTEDLSLPKKYMEIETQLVKMKAGALRDQQLVQAEMQRKNDLITYLAHDLKTPLASVIGYLSLLDEAADMPTEQKAKYTGIALDKAYRLEELINEFFDITRFNLQSIVLNKGKIKLAYMLRQMAEEFYPMLSPQGKIVSLYIPEDLILYGDADKLARVFNNIIKNAIAYSYEGSSIDIAAEQRGDYIIITFTNEGDPIPIQRLETIFEKFYRLDSARSTNTGGAGLGMAIAKEIVEAHDGTIAAESNLEKTCFIVKLPS